MSDDEPAALQASHQPHTLPGARRKVVLYNPRAVFFTMPLALLAIGSELDPAKYEVIIVDGRLDPDPAKTLARLLPGAVCLGVTVLTGASDRRCAASVARRQTDAPRRARRLGRLASLDVRQGVPARVVRGHHRAGAG